MRTTRIASPSCAALLALLYVPLALSQALREFEVEYTTVPGQSVYVLGDLPQLGGGNPAFALKLDPSGYPDWRARIALPAGRTYSYQYTWRNDSVPQWRVPENHNPFGPVLTGSTPAAALRPAAKGLFYHSAWQPPRLHWRLRSTDAFALSTMLDVGPGRAPNERRWKAVAPAAAGEEIEFYFSDAAGGRDPSSGAYRTRLDALFVQSGQVFGYVPPATVSAQQQRNFAGVASAALGQTRPYRVLLPRGYAENEGKRYPVLYLHDGQNVFDMGPFGTWNADETINALTRGGQLRELLVVAVDNTSTRLWDYQTPDDLVPFGPGAGQPGRANLYARFLIDELKPLIDSSYRTLTGAETTGALGSSMGGLVSLYLGWDHTAGFTRIGAMSGSWQFPAFVSRVRGESARVIRVYFDSGDSGASFDNAWPTMSLRDNFLSKGYVLGDNLQHVVGYGDQHNEAAWARRLPGALTFLYPVTEESDLAQLRDEIFRGDMNCDGVVNFTDIDAFVAALVGEAEFEQSQPTCRREFADVSRDGRVDFEDIGAFACCLVAGHCGACGL